MTNPAGISYLKTGDGRKIAHVSTQGESGKAALVWLGGFKSDMDGTKAVALEDWAQRTGRSFLRFDYTGHGHSSGDFEDGSIGEWTRDAIDAFDQLTTGPQILIGSSMGGWISLNVALARAERLSGMLLIAPAPDFTSELMWPSFPENVRQTIMSEGRLVQESDDPDEPFIITRKLIETGPASAVLDKSIPFFGPVRILQGELDESVPWQHARRCLDIIESRDIEFTLIKGGDHRLSDPVNLARLEAAAESLSLQVES